MIRIRLLRWIPREGAYVVITVYRRRECRLAPPKNPEERVCVRPPTNLVQGLAKVLLLLRYFPQVFVQRFEPIFDRILEFRHGYARGMGIFGCTTQEYQVVSKSLITYKDSTETYRLLPVPSPFRGERLFDRRPIRLHPEWHLSSS